MSTFNKKEYNLMYNKNNRKCLNFGMSIDEYNNFITACEHIKIERSFYIKALINADMIDRGMQPIFTDGRTKKTVLLSTNDE